MTRYNLHEKAVEFVRDAGGRLVGRTRLQKVAYLSQLAGFADNFSFEYRHYGPYSEELAEAMEIASALGIVTEVENQTEWGGWYSVYDVCEDSAERSGEVSNRAEFVKAASKFGAIELELAATAAFLYLKEREEIGSNYDPWKETALLKPEKATPQKLKNAKKAYKKLRDISTPNSLPAIV